MIATKTGKIPPIKAVNGTKFWIFQGIALTVIIALGFLYMKLGEPPVKAFTNPITIFGVLVVASQSLQRLKYHKKHVVNDPKRSYKPLSIAVIAGVVALYSGLITLLFLRNETFYTICAVMLIIASIRMHTPSFLRLARNKKR